VSSADEALGDVESPDSGKNASDTLSSDEEEFMMRVSKNAGLRFVIPRILSDEGDFAPCFKEVVIDTSNRLDTHLKSDGQGDHTTAYIAIMEMLVSAIAGEDIQTVPETLCELAKSFLDQEDYNYLETVKASVTQSLRENVISRSERKQLTNAMRVIAYSEKKNLSREQQQASSIIDAQRKKLKTVIKQQEQVFLLEVVCRIGETIVAHHQNDPLAVVSKKRVKGTAERPGGEGNRVKMAMLNLKLLNHLIALKNKMAQVSLDNDRQELLEDYQEIFTDIISCRETQY
jgi:hypothetical protein